MTTTEAEPITCANCGHEVADPSIAFCPRCGQAIRAVASDSAVGHGAMGPQGPSYLRRFWPAIGGLVLIPLGALLLVVPFYELDGDQVSIMQGRDLCSSVLGPWMNDCSTIGLLFFGGLFAIAVGLILLAVGLVRGSQSPSTHQGLAGTSPQQIGGMPRPVSLPITWPTTWSGWMIGIGSALGVLAFLLPWSDGYGYFASWGLARPTNVIGVIVLVGVAATVFVPDRMPSFALRQLAVLITLLVGVGVGLDQIGGTPTLGALLFFVGMLVAASGSVSREVPGAAPALTTTTVGQERLA